MSRRSKDDRSEDAGDAAAPDLDEIAARYLDLWQDQVSALAADPEFAEAWRKLVESLGTQTMAWQAQGLPPGFPMAGGLPDPMAALQAMMSGARPATAAGGKDEGQHDDGNQAKTSAGGAKAEARSAAAAAASRGRGDELEQLAARLDQLEKRIAALEAKPAGKGGGARKRNRKPRS